MAFRPESFKRMARFAQVSPWRETRHELGYPIWVHNSGASITPYGAYEQAIRGGWEPDPDQAYELYQNDQLSTFDTLEQAMAAVR
mgnify:CR=1 FL=1